jgi:hypothetical protein
MGRRYRSLGLLKYVLVKYTAANKIRYDGISTLSLTYTHTHTHVIILFPPSLFIGRSQVIIFSLCEKTLHTARRRWHLQNVAAAFEIQCWKDSLRSQIAILLYLRLVFEVRQGQGHARQGILLQGGKP